MEVQEPKLLSVQEFANRVNRTERAVYKAIKTGRIKAVKAEDGSAFQIPEEEVNGYGSGTNSRTSEPIPELWAQVQERIPETVQEQVQNFDPVLARVHELVQEGFLGALERANDEIRRVERQKVELELQLRLHRNLLTENAESLVEKQAESQTFRQQADTLAQRIAELEQQNAQLFEERNRSWWSKIWSKRTAPPSSAQTA